MKKLFALLIVAAAAVLIIFFGPSPKSRDTKATGPVASKQPQEAHAKTPENTPKLQPDATTPPQAKFGPHSAFLDSDIMAAVRAAVQSGDRDAFERAFEALTEYIRAHPEKIDDYIASLRSEPNEHVLRALARAIAASEAIWGDKLAQTAIELAKDTSYEQRQHIMLHLMSGFSEMRDDLYQAILERSRNDPNSQVKTSAVVVMADWMEKFPENNTRLITEVGEALKSAVDEDVRAFAYQVLALHKEKLPPDIQNTLLAQLKTEPNSFNANLIVLALTAAPENIRKDSLAYLHSSYNKESDMETKRNQLAQIVCIERDGANALLKEIASGKDPLLAEDAHHYLAFLSSGDLELETIFQQKAVRDNLREGSDKHKDHD